MDADPVYDGALPRLRWWRRRTYRRRRRPDRHAHRPARPRDGLWRGRHQLLLFGGTGTEGTSPSADRNLTWRWDGTTWTRIATAGPSPRNQAALTYDATRQRVVLFGGFNATTNTELRDIWEWDGTAWQQSTSSASTGTLSLKVAYDEKTSALYLFSITGTALSAYRWNGSAVTAAAAATTPFVPAQRRFVALGSNPGGFLFYMRTCDLAGATSDPRTWRWDGTAWSRVPGTQPPLRFNAAMAYDRDRNQVVLYAGEVAANTPDLADTWEFDGTAWARR
jgi:hypothetical protein